MQLSKSPLPILIAHRGASREAPENTLPAFERAISLGADGIEFDVLLTLDKVPIVTHNNDLSILTHFDGFAHETAFAAIKSLDFGSHFRTSYSHVRVPTLTDVLELLLPHDLSVICELKEQPRMAFHIAELVGGIVSDFHFRNSFILSSSSLKILYYLNKLYPKIPRAFIFKRSYPLFFAKFLHVNELHICYTTISDDLIAKAHNMGLKVMAWTVNRPDEVDSCVKSQVDGIITDDLVMAKAVLNRSS